MKKMNLKFLAESAILAALYVVLTWAFAPLSYGPVQFRISEILMLLVVLNPKFAGSLVVGCFLSNTFSSLGWYDMVFGSLATLIAVIPMCFVRKLPVAAMFPVLSNAFIISLELGFAMGMWNEAYWYNVLTIGIGEAAVLYFVGIPFAQVLLKNKNLVTIMDFDDTKAYEFKYINTQQLLASCIAALGVMLFVAYPMYFYDGKSYSLLSMSFDGAFWLWSVVCVLILYALIYCVLTGFAKLFITHLLSIGILLAQIFIAISYRGCLSNFYYYLYYFYPLVVMALPLYDYYKNKKEKNREVSEQ